MLEQLQLINQPCLISTFIGCLDDDATIEKLKLFEGFPLEILKIPTFDYASFLHELHFSSLHDAVTFWCEGKSLDRFQNEGRDIILYPVKTILVMLIEQFMEKSTNLSKLSIPVITHRDGEFLSLKKHETMARKRLPKIRYLDCDDCMIDNLRIAYETCTNLSRLDIDCSWGNDEHVSKLLEVQNRLQHLTVIKRCPYLKNAINDGDLRRSLRCVVFKDNRNYTDNGGPLNVLAPCKRLEILRFDNWLPFREDDMKELVSNSFPRLRKLSFTRCEPKAEIIINMILTNGFSLQELTFSLPWYDKQSNVIKTIAENCPNLTYLDVPFAKTDLEPFCELLKSCKKLESLTIKTLFNRGELPYDVDNFLPIIGAAIPKSLCQFNIFAHWTFTVESLRNFLMKDCKNDLRCLGFLGNITDDHLEVIETYAYERKSLHYLELRSCDTSFKARKSIRKFIYVNAYDSFGKKIA
ncbi:1819_t:CDS:2 [Funneliformis geosporum]|uniref:12609_t:CDS:1 n=1 Tax=Funneliformis geosporum TaxID=1117311 RepID=A0A9W4WHZ4_9GLOM|nr:12609_t:CDS:2 [Funneliformis geosporum]CAI2167369.1 1819_t:CDS:2 [Funneliformis geosporum]